MKKLLPLLTLAFLSCSIDFNTSVYKQETYDRVYPDPLLTKGSVFENLSVETLCSKDYTRQARKVPSSLKAEVYKRYGIEKTANLVIDHFVNLGIGGDNKIENLWPQPIRQSQGLGSRQKDEVENYLRKKICSGMISISDAQDLVKTDWAKVYRKIKADQNPDSEDED